MGNSLLPKGQNFRLEKDVDLLTLADSLQQIAAFLQDLESSRNIKRFDDWWEHDGSHFLSGDSSMQDLFECVKSPQAIQASMPGDDLVFVGFSANDYSWYLRFYLEYDDSGYVLKGRFDLTLADTIVNIFREKVIPKLSGQIIEEEASAYFKRIIL